jgi:hypothetical protein
MKLARHSDPKLTMARYGKAQLVNLAGVAQRLTRLLLEDGEAQPFSCTPVAQSATVSCPPLPSAATGAADVLSIEETKKPLPCKGLRAAAGG